MFPTSSSTNAGTPVPSRGPHRNLSAAQLWRVHVLAVLTPTPSFNQLVALLSEQRAWREFARLSHRHRGPDARMLNEFRSRVGVSGSRAINDTLRLPLIEQAEPTLRQNRLMMRFAGMSHLPHLALSKFVTPSSKLFPPQPSAEPLAFTGLACNHSVGWAMERLYVWKAWRKRSVSDSEHMNTSSGKNRTRDFVFIGL